MMGGIEQQNAISLTGWFLAGLGASWTLSFSSVPFPVL